MTIVDLFAGAGGWDLGAREIGLDPIGLENWGPAIDTRRAAGLRTIVTHLAMEPVHEWAHPNVPPVAGLIASPPCPDWSAAGSRAKRDGKTGSLVDVPMVWARALRPRWLAWEQVPPAIEVWEVNATELHTLGYSVWTGILNSANFGVPQTRERAFLLASLDRPALPPEPTHARAPEPSLFGAYLEPWVSMADALGFDGAAHTNRGQRLDGSRQVVTTDRPAPCVMGTSDRWQWELPATTVTGDPRLSERCSHRDGGQSTGPRLTIQQALVLQTFPPDYPLQGTKSDRFKQVGNAVPPLLAAKILAQLTPETP